MGTLRNSVHHRLSNDKKVLLLVGENGGAPPFGEHRPPKYNEKWLCFGLIVRYCILAAL